MTAKILEPTTENIAFLGERLRAGEVVAMPTETVYGLAASVWDESALAQVFAVKERPRFDPLICHVANGAAPERSWLSRLVELELLSETAIRDPRYRGSEQLARQFWPGPLTLVLPKASRVSDLATSGLETLGVRVPRHPVAQALLQSAGSPLCAPSANRFGQISPTSAQDVFEELGDRIDWILDGGPCRIGVESTVLAFEEIGPRILRRGGISQEDLQVVLGREVALAPLGEVGSGRLASPGMLASHYAPHKKLFLAPKPISKVSLVEMSETLRELPLDAHLGLLVWSGDGQSQWRIWEDLAWKLPTAAQIVSTASLSKSGDEAEAARNLFRQLRRLDADERTTHLIAEPPAQSYGLGGAILDRLQRAAK